MPEVPTGKMERKLRQEYLKWLAGLSDQTDMTSAIKEFEARSRAVITTMGGHAASLGALADFPVPRLLELSPYADKVYDKMQQAAIQAGIAAGLNSRDTARQILNAGLGKSYKQLERLARTETVSAYWKNSWDSIADLPMIVMVWGSETSKKTCDYCLSRDGMVVEDGNIRDHPNGRCTLIPTLRSEVEYKGTLRPDGSIFMDPDWNKKPALPGLNLKAEEVRSGTLAAERQRVALEKKIYDRKGNYNATSGWTRETAKARGSYTEGGAQDMNALLRDRAAYQKRDDYDEFFAELFTKQIDELSEVISKNVLDEDIVVARGVLKAPGFDPSDLKVGDDFADPAFLSTTTNLKEAADFAAGRGRIDNAEGYTFISKVPKGTNAVPGADYQNEIIFKPGQQQKVIGIDHKTKTIYTEFIETSKAVKIPGEKVKLPPPASAAQTWVDAFKAKRPHISKEFSDDLDRVARGDKAVFSRLAEEGKLTAREISQVRKAYREGYVPDTRPAPLTPKVVTPKTPVAPKLTPKTPATPVKTPTKAPPVVKAPVKAPTAAPTRSVAIKTPKIDKLPTMKPPKDLRSAYVNGKVNPNGRGFKGLDRKAKTANLDYDVNCTRVTWATEMRMRGYDIKAGPAGLDKGDTKTNAFIEGNWKDPKGETRLLKPANSPDELLADMADNAPEGARFFVVGSWKRGGAHIWNAEKRDGKIIFHEAQVQTAVKGEALTQEYLRKLDFVTNRRSPRGQVRYMRVDDLTPSDKALTEGWAEVNGKVSR
jgi:hypothetical protein